MRPHPVLVFALSLLLGVGTPLGASPDEGLPEAAFTRLQRLVHAPRALHFNASDLLLARPVREETPDAGGVHLVAGLPPGCGMLDLQALPFEDAHALLGDLFHAYGFTLARDVVLDEEGVRARLDGYDRAARVGYRFVRADVKPRATGDPYLEPAPAEPEGEALDVDERRRLARSGARVLFLPENLYTSLPPDPLPALWALGLEALRSLEEADGDAAAVEALALAEPVLLDLPGIEAEDVQGAQSFSNEGPATFFVLKQSRTLELEVSPGAGSRAGRSGPTYLVLGLMWVPPSRDGTYDASAPGPKLRLVQGKVDVTSESGAFLLPATFDPARPFTLGLGLTPGQVHLRKRLGVFRAP